MVRTDYAGAGAGWHNQTVEVRFERCDHLFGNDAGGCAVAIVEGRLPVLGLCLMKLCATVRFVQQRQACKPNIGSHCVHNAGH